MPLRYTTDIWREILLKLDSFADVLAVAQSYPAFAVLLKDPSFLRVWLNSATPRVPYEFGAVEQLPYAYGDWTMAYVLPQYRNPSLRFQVEFLLGKGCSADVPRDGKILRCGLKAGFSTRDEHTFSFDLLKEGWKICKQCLGRKVIFLDDVDSLLFLKTFSKVFPSNDVEFPEPPRKVFRHLEKRYSYLRMDEVDQYIRTRSAGLFESFATWKAGVIAKRGSTSELTIRALQHGARGFLELPGGPVRTRIAMEIAGQQIREYQHNMINFQARNHPDMARVGPVHSF